MSVPLPHVSAMVRYVPSVYSHERGFHAGEPLPAVVTVVHRDPPDCVGLVAFDATQMLPAVGHSFVFHDAGGTKGTGHRPEETKR